MLPIYVPHTITVFNQTDPASPRCTPTVLRGVMVQALDRRSVSDTGSTDVACTTFFIPFSVDARDADSAPVSFLPPLAFDRSEDPSAHWTLRPSGDEAGRSTFLIRGAVPESLTLAEARARFDGVCIVAAVSIRDYGSPSMHHFEVSTQTWSGTLFANP